MLGCRPVATAWPGTALRIAWSFALKRFPPAEPIPVRFDGGRSRILADIRTAFGRQLYRFRGASPDLEFVRSALGPGDVFIDGGAHVGMFSLVAARAVGPSGAVYAFEPNPLSFAMLRRNVELNEFRNVCTFAEALGEDSGSAEFAAMPGDEAPWSHLGPPRAGVEANTITVRVTTLTERVPEEVWRRVRLVKLDLEGAEHAALLGAEPLLRQARPDLLVEYVAEHQAQAGTDPAALPALMRAWGYALLTPTRHPCLWRDLDGNPGSVLSPGRPNLLATMRPERYCTPRLRAPGSGATAR